MEHETIKNIHVMYAFVGAVKQLFLTGLMVLCLVASFSPVAMAQGKSDKVKAVFLFKFFDYVTWPSGENPKDSGQGVLCTYGAHSFGGSLDYIAARKTGDYDLRTKVVSSLSDTDECHVLYVARKHYKDISTLHEKGILVVGDADGVLDRGGVIELHESGGKVKLVIDLTNAKARNLKISSRLLDIADVRR